MLSIPAKTDYEVMTKPGMIKTGFRKEINAKDRQLCEGGSEYGIIWYSDSR